MKKFKYICQLKENGNYYKIYYNENDNYFVKMTKNEIIKINEDDDIKLYQIVDLFRDDLKKCETKKRKVKNFKKGSKYLISLLLCISMASFGISNLYNFIKEQEIEEEFLENNSDILEIFKLLISQNKTISPSLEKDIERYLKVYVERLNELNINKLENNIKIGKVLRDDDFSNIDKVNLDTLRKIIAVRNSEFISIELYNKVNDLQCANKKINTISNFLYIVPEGVKTVFKGSNIEIYDGNNNFVLDLDNIDDNSDYVFNFLDYFVFNNLLVPNSIQDRSELQTNLFSSELGLYVEYSDIYNYYKSVDGKLLDIDNYMYYYELYKKILEDNTPKSFDEFINDNLENTSYNKRLF